MIAHHHTEPHWRRIRSAGRIGFALAGGGLFALLAWEPVQKYATGDSDSRLSNADRPGRHDASDLQDDWNRRDALSTRFKRDDSQIRSPDPWGVATIETGKRFDSNRERDIGSEPGSSTEVRSWFTATADGGLRATPIRDSRGPPE